MLIEIECRLPLASRSRSQRAIEVAAMFGLDGPSDADAGAIGDGLIVDGSIDDASPPTAGRRERSLRLIPRTTIDLPLGESKGGIVFITGPSGSGKSTLLRLISEACATRGVRVRSLSEGDPAAVRNAAVIDLVAPDQPLARALEILALVGLSDAFIMLRRPHELSDGQRFRFRIAQLLGEITTARTGEATANQPTLIVIDEFAAALDRITAKSLARNIRRWCDRVAASAGASAGAGVSFLLATTHDDLLESLQPDLLIHKGLGDAVDVIRLKHEAQRRAANSDERIAQQAETACLDFGRHPAHDDMDNTSTMPLGRIAAHVTSRLDFGRHPAPIGVDNSSMMPHRRIDADGVIDDFVIEAGTLDDYRALASFHYRSHHPGAATSVLRITQRASTVVGRHLQRRDDTTLVGVLVRSLPALNCALRDRALADRYASLDARERGIVINREARCISRVVIEPRFRGLGLAVRLVRHALEHPERDSLLYTEALAAMGRVSPFFERAGMTRFEGDHATRPAYERFEAAIRATTSQTEANDDEIPRDPHPLLMREAMRFLRAARRMSHAKFNMMSPSAIVREAMKRLRLHPTYFIFHHAVHAEGTPFAAAAAHSDANANANANANRAILADGAAHSSPAAP